MIMQINGVDYEGLDMEEVKEKLRGFVRQYVCIGNEEELKEVDWDLMTFDELEGAFF